MLKTSGTFVIAALCLTIPAMGEQPGARSSRRGGVVGQKMSATPVRALLRKHVDKVEWVELTFEEVLSWLRGMAEDNVNIIPRWNALNAEGVDMDSPVTLKLKDTTVAEVMDEVLDQLSEDGQVVYRGERNMLRISTKDELARKLEVKVYDVTDILFVIPDMGRSAPLVDLQAATRSSTGGGGGGQGVFRGSSSGQSEELQEEEEDIDERLEELRDMIYAVIEPQSWIPAGGLGTVEAFNKRYLIVRNTIEVHEQIAGLFEYDR
ncbi:MAG: hypothetical protein ACE5HE_07260 [Phycisphaerae bacterium]